jgi:hypothetical protein
MWSQVNQIGTPTYNGNFPTSAVVAYNAPNTESLAQLSPLAALQNASNYQWFVMGKSSKSVIKSLAANRG